MEVYNYLHCYAQETDPRIKAIWDEFLHMELTHLQLWGQMLMKYEGRDPEVVFGNKLTVDFRFQENKEYIRRVLEQQRDLRLVPGGWALQAQLPADWPSRRYQDIVNADGIPSEEMVNRQVHSAETSERPGDELLERAREAAVSLRGASDAVARAGV